MDRRVFQTMTCLVLCVPVICFGQTAPVKLWANGAPGSEPGTAPSAFRITPTGEHVITHVADPSIVPYLPPANIATAAAVIVIPGGRHSEIWIEHEGYDVAQWLSGHGIAAFVLQYRLAGEKGSKYTVEGTELADTQRAIRVVRSHSKEWNINPARIGVAGFSGGGELAELASTRYDQVVSGTLDTIDQLSAKPDFQVLIYPAIPHDLRITAQTPPAFLACGGQDRVEISQGLAELYLELARMHIPSELHIYAGVGHGFGIRPSNVPPVSEWPLLLLQWMDKGGFIRTP